VNEQQNNINVKLTHQVVVVVTFKHIDEIHEDEICWLFPRRWEQQKTKTKD